jgi:two-component system, cell cycle sensor histidine kinase PleC
VSDVNKAIVAEQLRLVMKSPAPIYSGGVLALIAAVVLQGELSSLALDGWAGTMLVWQGIRYLLWRRFNSLKGDAEVARQTHLVTAIWSVTGLLWGLLGAAYFLPDNLEAGFFILFIVTTNIAGGAVVVSSYLPAHAGYMLGMAIPSTIAFIMHGSRFSLILAGMSIGYVALARSAAYFGNASISDLIRLKVEKTKLVVDLRRAKADADEANQFKSRFLANVSHELRTPLNAIIGFSDIMRGEMFGAIGSPRYAGYVGDINDSGRLLLGIVNDVLDLSKFEAGSMRLAEELVDPAGLARECVNLVSGLAAANDVQIAIEPPLERIAIRGDEMRLKQVLLNLLSNAVKFSRDGGKVVLAERLAADGSFVVSVRDQGIGMDQAGIATALLPFGQVENSWTRRHTGTGLGLPLAKWLAEIHGGKLEIDSAPELGTTVRVILPASRVIRSASTAPALAAAE